MTLDIRTVWVNHPHPAAILSIPEFHITWCNTSFLNLNPSYRHRLASQTLTFLSFLEPICTCTNKNETIKIIQFLNDIVENTSSTSASIVLNFHLSKSVQTIWWTGIWIKEGNYIWINGIPIKNSISSNLILNHENHTLNHTLDNFVSTFS